MSIFDIYVLVGLYFYIMMIQKIALIIDSYSLLANYDFCVLCFKFNSIVYLFLKFIYKPEISTFAIMILIMLDKKIWQIFKSIFDVILDFIIINIQWIFWFGLIYTIFSIDNKIN